MSPDQFAAIYLSRILSLNVVQRMLGHKSVKSTEVYARSLEDVPEECMVRFRRASESTAQAQEVWTAR